jgi:hypothetical protein
MIMSFSLRWSSRFFMNAVALAAFVVVSACSDSTEPTPLDVHAVIVETEDGSAIYAHGDHWHGSASVDEGHSETLTIYYIDFEPAGHDTPPKSSWKRLPASVEVTAVVEDTAVATWTGDRLTGTLTGVAHGTTRISFVVRRAGSSTTLYEAPPMNIQVREHDHDHDHE